jgi:hypothetical protein
MNISIDIVASSNKYDFPVVCLEFPDGNPPCQVRANLGELWKLGLSPSPVMLDLVLLGVVVYALDRRVPRESARDNWTRHFSFTMPVSQPQIWEKVKSPLEECLSFLTSDLWEIEFSRLKLNIAGPVGSDLLLPPQSNAVSLFSGGLDSLIGVIDRLENHPQESLILLGHHDPWIGGPLLDQKNVFADLQSYYRSRIQPCFLAVGVDSGKDTTLRCRSFLFLALGLYAASTISPTTPLVVPENGTMALNVPLTPSRGGSCSTRTVHPYYLFLLRKTLSGLGIGNPIETPLGLKTKGECVADCLNPEALQAILFNTTSCAKRGHKRTWHRRNVKECGRCLPCIYRRAALNKVGLDRQIYGRDICAGEVDIGSNQTYAEDLRACFSFLRHNPNQAEIARLLLGNGRIDPSHLSIYAGIITRAMNEIRVLLQDKATAEVKRQAGL